MYITKAPYRVHVEVSPLYHTCPSTGDMCSDRDVDLFVVVRH